MNFSPELLPNRIINAQIKNKKMNNELSAGTADENSTKDDNLHVSPACIKPNVICCSVRENNAIIKKYLESLSKLIPIEWDRFTEDEDGDFNIYGWIKRKDGQRDFVLLNLFLEDGNIRSYKSGFATSSAKYSKMIYMCLYGTTKGHNSCRKIESLVV